jgi:hypothetical protein
MGIDDDYVECHISCPWLAKIDITVSVSNYPYISISVVLLSALRVNLALHLSSWHELGLEYYMDMHRIAKLVSNIDFNNKC